ncbi:MAG: hypothetical protein PHR83_18540 [Paludibacter sp.]|nr:hypothetical protein [Paludibacter sp.]
MGNNSLIAEAQKQLNIVNKEIVRVNQQIQEIQLDRNLALSEYQSRKADVDKGTIGKLWDWARGQRGDKKRALEESHQNLHNLDIKLQRMNEKLHQLNFNATELAQKANKEMFEDVVIAGNKTVEDVSVVHKRIDDLISTFELQFDNTNNSFNGALGSIIENLKNTNERLDDIVGKVKEDSKDSDEIAIELIAKIKELEETAKEIWKRVDDTSYYATQNIDKHTVQLQSINKIIEEEKARTEIELNGNKQQIKCAETNIQQLEATLQEKMNVFDQSLNSQQEKLNRIDKKIDEHKDDTQDKINEIKMSLKETNESIKSLQISITENLQSINGELKMFGGKFDEQLLQNRKFEELFETQRTNAIKLKRNIIIGTVIGSLGLAGSILVFLIRNI